MIIGKRCKGVPAADALGVVAGYTVINDISNRRFRPNPNRKQRPRDGFFDWLHGKWFDSSAPAGPCITSAQDLSDPQDCFLRLDLNGEIQQDSHTSRMIFSVAEVIEFISSFVTLEPGDLISTGTAAGVGKAKEKFLRHGDQVVARIEHIGDLVSHMRSEERGNQERGKSEEGVSGGRGRGCVTFRLFGADIAAAEVDSSRWLRSRRILDMIVSRCLLYCPNSFSPIFPLLRNKEGRLPVAHSSMLHRSSAVGNRRSYPFSAGRPPDRAGGGAFLFPRLRPGLRDSPGFRFLRFRF